MRVIDYRLEGIVDTEPLYRLVTTLLDPAAAPATELAALYHERWECEGTFAEFKVSLPGQRLMLRSRRADLAEQELYGFLLVHLALRQLMYARPVGRPGATRTRCPSSTRCGLSAGISRFMPRFPPQRQHQMHEMILIEIIGTPAEHSRGRHNPRVVKRKMSNFPTKARAGPSPPSSQHFHYSDLVRIVAPVMPETKPIMVAPKVPRNHARCEPNAARSGSSTSGRGAGQRPVTRGLCRAPRPEVAHPASMDRPLAPHLFTNRARSRQAPA